MSDIKKVKKALSANTARTPPIPDEDRLSLGLTVLDVAMSRGRWTDGGTAKGHFIWWVGESESGKTFEGVQLLAMAASNPQFDGYELIYDEAENGALMEVEQFFGSKLAKRLKVVRSTNVEDFYYGIYRLLKAGKKIVYVLDSMDALDSRKDVKKFETQQAAYEKQSNGDQPQEVAGTFGTSKAKWNSDNLKRLVDRIKATGSVLMVISQTRDVIGSPFPTKTTSGGLALRFYAHEQVWTKIVEKLTKKVHGESWEYGTVVEVKVRKNRVSGWHGRVMATFLSDHGFDDLGSSVDFLVKYKAWFKPKKSSRIKTRGFPVQGTREQIVRKCEDSPRLQSLLRGLVKRTFIKIDEAVTVKRKPRWL